MSLRPMQDGGTLCRRLLAPVFSERDNLIARHYLEVYSQPQLIARFRRGDGEDR